MITIIEAAGWPIWFLIIASVTAVALIVERLMYLRSKNIAPVTLLAEVVQEFVDVLGRRIFTERAQHGLAEFVGDITLEVRAAARLLVDHLVPVFDRILDHVVIVAVVNNVHISPLTTESHFG